MFTSYSMGICHSLLSFWIKVLLIYFWCYNYFNEKCCHYKQVPLVVRLVCMWLMLSMAFTCIIKSCNYLMAMISSLAINLHCSYRAVGTIYLLLRSCFTVYIKRKVVWLFFYWWSSEHFKANIQAERFIFCNLYSTILGIKVKFLDHKQYSLCTSDRSDRITLGSDIGS